MNVTYNVTVGVGIGAGLDLVAADVFYSDGKAERLLIKEANSDKAMDLGCFTKERIQEIQDHLERLKVFAYHSPART